MRKESFINDAKHINSETKIMQKKKRTCWNCKFRGNNILDEFGCCKRCGTNITRWKKKKDLPYPKELVDHKLLEDNVLGDRQKFTTVNDEGEDLDD